MKAHGFVRTPFHFPSEVDAQNSARELMLRIQLENCHVLFSLVFCHGYEGEEANTSTKVEGKCSAENITD